MGFDSEDVQPVKRVALDARTSEPLYKLSTVETWTKKWLNYKQYVIKNPVKLCHSSMSQKEYSTKVIQYLDKYRQIDHEFAEFCIQLLLMLPSSSASEHLFSICNNQVRPNIQFLTLAARTLVASNSGYFLNGTIK